MVLKPPNTDRQYLGVPECCRQAKLDDTFHTLLVSGRRHGLEND